MQPLESGRVPEGERKRRVVVGVQRGIEGAARTRDLMQCSILIHIKSEGGKMIGDGLVENGVAGAVLLKSASLEQQSPCGSDIFCSRTGGGDGER